MTDFNSSRRDALQKIGALTFGAGALAATSGCASIGQSEPIKWSAGTDLPNTKVPANACDCHHHIYDSRYPWAPEATLKPGDALIPEYRKLQARIGTTRNVIVQPSSYGVDNRLLVESIAAFGGRARGVAVVNTKVTDAELKALHAAGVRGIRFNLAPPGNHDPGHGQALGQTHRGWHRHCFAN